MTDWAENNNIQYLGFDVVGFVVVQPNLWAAAIAKMTDAVGAKNSKLSLNASVCAKEPTFHKITLL